MKVKYVKCVICEKQIETRKEVIAHKTMSSEGSIRITSDEGILFNFDDSYSKWFCNSCWNDIEKYVSEHSGWVDD